MQGSLVADEDVKKIKQRKLLLGSLCRIVSDQSWPEGPKVKNINQINPQC